MANTTNTTSLRMAALTAGIGLLIMVIVAPFAELYVYPKLVVPNDAIITTKNIIANRTIFVAAIFGYLLTFICDIIVAWALYILLQPVHVHLSLLTAWFRLIYTVIALSALLHLITVFRLSDTTYYIPFLHTDQLYAEVMLSLKAFKGDWYFGIIFFAIHLLLLGYLVLRSGYIPKVFGLLLIITGLGYLLTSLRPFLFPDMNADF